MLMVRDGLSANMYGFGVEDNFRVDRNPGTDGCASEIEPLQAI